MKRLARIKGGLIIEVIAGISFLGMSVFAALSGVQYQKKTTLRSQNRWLAQLTAENVTDTLGSLAVDQLLTVCKNVPSGMASIGQTQLPWLSTWQGMRQGSISQIQVSFNFVTDTGANATCPQPASLTAAQFAQWKKNIVVGVSYQRSLDAGTPVETVQWTKTIAPE
ncbi:hypothetical protein K2X33_09135 [bacterium]|nr:hypothetical protein [bacterium]